MKIYSCPDEVPFAEPDYANYDPHLEHDRELKHQDELKEWLLNNGYPGPLTGGILSEPHADGYANYMMADGPKSALIHLPYGDAWHSKNIEFLPKKEVVARIRRSQRLASIFSEKKSA